MLIGESLGPFRILAKLGEGGMGEVYRARDTRLDRDVAVKILPGAFATDPDRLIRFEREAKTLASLNHPNIAQIFGVEQSGSLRALVMELVEGSDLAVRIARGPVPLEEVLPIARQIAEALEAAHEAGIIHRDLKPANIKVREDGTVKVLDFGLAKALDPVGSGDLQKAAHSPTFTSPAVTQLGVLLGTAAYMAPEQARGKTVDKRADIWAFGCVLYELLTGRTAYAGETVTDTLAAIMTRSPDLEALPRDTPAAMRQLLVRCLERDPKRRLRDIGEARLALEDRAQHGEPPDRVAPGNRPRPFPWIAAVLLTALAVGIVVWQLRAPADPPVRRFLIATPDGAEPLTAAISPTGETIAFVANDRVWLQRLDAFTPVEVPSTEGARAVFWSPDGAVLGFQARSQLWKIPMEGGAAVALARVPQDFTSAGGATWLEDGRIAFTTGGTGLLVIPAAGGPPASLLDLQPAAESDFHNVSALPGGRGLLFVTHPASENEPYRIEALDSSTGTRQIVHVGSGGPARPVYSRTGHVLFAQGGGVWAIPFSIGRMVPTGSPTLLVPRAGDPSISGDGTLVMLSGGSGSDARLTWVDRSGKPGAALGQPNAPASNPRVSPDGRLVAATVGVAPETDIWIFDTERGTDRRLTFDAGRDAYPSWTPDGQHVVYHCGQKVCAFRADGSGGRVELLDNVSPLSPPVVSPDGKLLVFVRDSEPSDADLWVVELGPDGVSAPITASPRRLIRAERVQRQPDISPDGRFIAYVSAEQGVFRVYASRFPAGDGKWEVSRGFGAWPRWGAAGDRLYFFDDLRQIAELEVDLRTSFEAGQVVARISSNVFGQSGFDVARDGRQVLLSWAPGDRRPTGTLLLVQSWAAEFQARGPAQ